MQHRFTAVKVKGGGGKIWDRVYKHFTPYKFQTFSTAKNVAKDMNMKFARSTTTKTRNILKGKKWRRKHSSDLSSSWRP